MSAIDFDSACWNLKSVIEEMVYVDGHPIYHDGHPVCRRLCADCKAEVPLTDHQGSEMTYSNKIVLTEEFSGVLLTTEEGNSIGVCMRDDTFEINVIPKDKPSRWNRVDMLTGKITGLK